MKDLCAEEPNYLAPKYVNSCDTFSTFGWCSERAMAFVCLLEMMGYQGQVVVNGPHSWSEFLIPMTGVNGRKTLFRVKVDNTYHRMNWKKAGNRDQVKKRWQRLEAQAERGEWYNDKAHSKKIREKIEDYTVPKQARQRIERKVVTYLRNKLSNH